MPEIIPAAPGWYVQEPDGDLDPVIAWRADTDEEGRHILLPYLDGGIGYPPCLMRPVAMQSLETRVVYLPKHDPGAEQSEVAPPQKGKVR